MDPTKENQTNMFVLFPFVSSKLNLNLQYFLKTVQWSGLFHATKLLILNNQ